MANRIRNTYDVAHVWAQQTKCSGKLGNVSFSGTEYVSYSTSVARFHERKNKRAVLFDSRNYSITTTSHVIAARSAIRGLNVEEFTVPDINPGSIGHIENWKYYLDEIRESIGKADRARTCKDRYLSRASSLIGKANRYSTFFALRKRLPSDIATITEQLEREQQKIKKAEKRKQADRQKAIEQRERERFGAWIRDDSVKYVFGKTYLRILENEDENDRYIETSRYASFPVDHAVKAWPLIKRCKEKSTEFKPNGHSIHLGHFTVDRIDATGTVYAGCHVVTFDEVERIARQLDLA